MGVREKYEADLSASLDNNYLISEISATMKSFDEKIGESTKIASCLTKINRQVNKNNVSKYGRFRRFGNTISCLLQRLQ